MRPMERKIAGLGAISFKDYMELCLYHPTEGYYPGARNIFGVKGDYITAPHISPLFGKILGEQFIEIGEKLGELQVVEAGAGDGKLAGDVLERFRERGVGADYTIVEPFKNLEEVQRDRLEGFGVKWVRSMDSLQDVRGCIFSNELIDSLPVHVVERGEKKLKEVYVTLERGKLKEELRDPGREVMEYFEEQGIELLPGQRAEVNLEALKWLGEVPLNRGCIITIDYGYPAERLYSGERMKGTLMSYVGHRASADPYSFPGKADLTAHVNFTALKLQGEKLGLKCLGYTDLASFLLGAGAERVMEEVGHRSYSSYLKELQPLKGLIMPGGMGTTFKVLVQGRNFAEKLAGLEVQPFIKESLCTKRY